MSVNFLVFFLLFIVFFLVILLLSLLISSFLFLKVQKSVTKIGMGMGICIHVWRFDICYKK